MRLRIYKDGSYVKENDTYSEITGYVDNVLITIGGKYDTVLELAQAAKTLCENVVTKYTDTSSSEEQSDTSS